MSLFSHPRLAGAFSASLLVIAALGGPAATYAAATAAPPAIHQLAGADGGGADADAQPTEALPTDEQPTDEQPTGSMDDGFDGEIVYDPYFISPEPDETPASSPAGNVVRSTDRPGLTPPATDTAPDVNRATGGSSVPVLLAGLAALSITVFALGRVPGARAR